MRGLNAGDLVLLKKVSPKEYKVWPTIVDYMEPFLGLVVTVAKSKLGDSDTTFRIMEDKGGFLWSYWMIEKRISNDEIICWAEGRH